MEEPASEISPAALAEVKWWWARLSQPMSAQLSMLPARALPVLDMNVYTDASIRAIGVSINRRWLAWNLVEPLSTERSDVVGYSGWAELIAIELALRALIAQGHVSCQIPVHVDSTEAILCLERGFSRELDQNTIVRRIVTLGQTSGIVLKLVHVPSHVNAVRNLTDGTIPSASRRFPHDVLLPDELRDYLVAV